jgi:hypothetical protein
MNLRWLRGKTMHFGVKITVANTQLIDDRGVKEAAVAQRLRPLGSSSKGTLSVPCTGFTKLHLAEIGGHPYYRHVIARLDRAASPVFQASPNEIPNTIADNN